MEMRTDILRTRYRSDIGGIATAVFCDVGKVKKLSYNNVINKIQRSQNRVTDLSYIFKIRLTKSSFDKVCCFMQLKYNKKNRFSSYFENDLDTVIFFCEKLITVLLIVQTIIFFQNSNIFLQHLLYS